MTLVSCAAPSYLEKHGEPATPDDLRGHRLLGLRSTSGAPPEWHFPPPHTPRRLKLHFALTFNTVEGPIMAATEGSGYDTAPKSADRKKSEWLDARLDIAGYNVPGRQLAGLSSGGQSVGQGRGFGFARPDARLQQHGAWQPGGASRARAREDRRRPAVRRMRAACASAARVTACAQSRWRPDTRPARESGRSRADARVLAAIALPIRGAPPSRRRLGDANGRWAVQTPCCASFGRGFAGLIYATSSAPSSSSAPRAAVPTHASASLAARTIGSCDVISLIDLPVLAAY